MKQAHKKVYFIKPTNKQRIEWMARTGFGFMRKRCNDGAGKKNGKKLHVQHYLDSR